MRSGWRSEWRAGSANSLYSSGCSSVAVLCVHCFAAVDGQGDVGAGRQSECLGCEPAGCTQEVQVFCGIRLHVRHSAHIHVSTSL